MSIKKTFDMIAQVVKYTDNISPQSWKAAVLNSNYSIKVLQTKFINKTTEELVIYGDEKHVKAFAKDVANKTIKPLVLMANGITQSDYTKWLYNEIYYYDQLVKQQVIEDREYINTEKNEYFLDYYF